MRPSARPIVVASNRGPVSFEVGREGELVASRGGGGLVAALTGVLTTTGGEWVAAAMTEGDRVQAARGPRGRIDVPGIGDAYTLRYLTVDSEVFDRYYNVVSNRILWFVHHYLWDTPRTPRFGEATIRAWQDYVAVNGAFAEALDQDGPGPEPAFLVQDYHLSLVPRMLRERRPAALINHFTHTPFAGPGYLRILPTEMQLALLRGLLGADVLGFHDEAWAESFLLCCRHLPGARVDLRRRVVDLEGRRTLVRIYPIAIDVPGLREAARREHVRAIRAVLRRERGDGRLLLRVDRMELSKNILRGFLAYEAFLRRHGEWKDRVRFLALLNPSRHGIPEYRAYTRECLRAADRVNAELGTPEWRPIDVAIRDDFPRAVAAYCEYDVLLVNPVIDGMNLVAMEGPVLNRRKGVLVLSHEAGAFSKLGRHALGVNPFDVGETARAIHLALIMEGDERGRRAAALKRVVSRTTPQGWIEAQLDDLERVAGQRPVGAVP
jgi:trehalose 6-phosphate synthase